MPYPYSNNEFNISKGKLMNISGVLVKAYPEHITSIEDALATMSGVEVHGNNEDGRIVITSATNYEQSFKGPIEFDNIRVGEYFVEGLFLDAKNRHAEDRAVRRDQRQINPERAIERRAEFLQD